MIEHRILLTSFVFAFVAPALAQQALVQVYGRPGQEVGQAYLTHYDGHCYAILPGHVVEEAGVPALMREGPARLLGESVRSHDLGDDLSIAEVSGAIENDCGYSAASLSRSVTQRLRASGIATIRSVNGDGTIAQIPVALMDDDGELFLRVQPTNEINQIRKGQSGSLLMAGDTPVGMLLSVDARFGVGKVMRLDGILDRFDEFVTAPAEAAGVDTMTASALRLTAWSALPVDAAHRPVNLADTGDAPPWAARSDSWPVELDFDFAGEKRVVTGVLLDTKGVADPGQLPGGVEILISVAEDTPRWRSITGERLEFDDGSETIRFAPLWARQLRLSFTGAANGGEVISLGRVRVLGN
jgi:hypothetical protein